MPNFVIHEKVGYDIGKILNKYSYNYYLGLLAPDSNKIRVYLSDKERWYSHVRVKDYDSWKILLKNFYYDNIEYFDKDFLLGYIIHILTDIIYDVYYYNDVINRMKNDCICTDNYHQLMFMDMDNYYFDELYGIMDILRNGSTTYKIQNIKNSEMRRWKNLEISRVGRYNTCYYINDEIIKGLEEKVMNELLKDYL